MACAIADDHARRRRARRPVQASRCALTRSARPCSASSSMPAYSPLTSYTAQGCANVPRQIGEHVEVGHAGLHHQDVRAFGHIALHGQQRIAGAAPDRSGSEARSASAAGASWAPNPRRRGTVRRSSNGTSPHSSSARCVRGRCSSSALRMAPMRPSIMSLGATQSAPASRIGHARPPRVPRRWRALSR